MRTAPRHPGEEEGGAPPPLPRQPMPGVHPRSAEPHPEPRVLPASSLVILIFWLMSGGPVRRAWPLPCRDSGKGYSPTGGSSARGGPARESTPLQGHCLEVGEETHTNWGSVMGNQRRTARGHPREVTEEPAHLDTAVGQAWPSGTDAALPSRPSGRAGTWEARGGQPPGTPDRVVTVANCCCRCSVAQSCPILCDSMDCSTPGLPDHHQLPAFTQIRVHRVGHDGHAIQQTELSPSSPPALNLSQH